MPTSNAFLIINLGCEMMYVIDQRLKAQGISLEKSAQVLRDLTCVLFDQKLIVQLMNPHPCQHILTVQQCRILLTDIACCSLMRLDMTSMDKLWDLMVMLFKWQLNTIRDNPTRLLELTFRHMDGVAKLMPEMKKTLLVDSTKRSLIEFWDTCSSDEIDMLMGKLLQWMHPFNVKISILIRSGFQRSDGTFETAPSGQLYIDHFQDYVDNIGENIYAKTANSAKSKSRKGSTSNQSADQRRNTSISNELSTLASQLNVGNDIVSEEPEAPPAEADAEKPTGDGDDAESCATESTDKNDLVVDDVDCSLTNDNVEIVSTGDESSTGSEFIHLKKTTTALQSYLEQFQMENIRGEGEAFDATEELLKMLDKDNEK